MQPRSTLVAVRADCSRVVCSLTHQRPSPEPHSDYDDHTHRGRSAQHTTPSRVPLIWRAPGEPRRAPTPPPRKTPPLWSPPGRVPLLVVLLLLALYLALGAAAFASWKGWSLLDATYFCFVTLSTIGFADMLPTRSLTKDSSESQWQTVACCTYLLLGLVLIAMGFSLLQEEVVTRGRHMANAIGLAKRDDLAL